VRLSTMRDATERREAGARDAIVNRYSYDIFSAVLVFSLYVVVVLLSPSRVSGFLL